MIAQKMKGFAVDPICLYIEIFFRLMLCLKDKIFLHNLSPFRGGKYR